ncbi:hypothetical protein, partial [Streptomyces uncialis]|uniref:hypothetical protein n=1 Tax=Streptomyces uncialis TaxID=1048205 RepID=UPI003496703A
MAADTTVNGGGGNDQITVTAGSVAGSLYGGAGADTITITAPTNPASAALDFGGRDAARIRLCVDGTCKEKTSGSADDPFATMSVRLPDDIGASTVAVRLTVTSGRSGDTIVKDSIRAELTEQHPNSA